MREVFDRSFPPEYYQDEESIKKILRDQYRAEIEARSELLGGVKYDEDKLPIHLVPPRAILAIAEVLQYGTKKYTPRNWERGLPWSRLYSATMRHLLAWWGGEDRDTESSLYHLYHAICNLAFLIEYVGTHTELDDRPTGTEKRDPPKEAPYP